MLLNSHKPLMKENGDLGQRSQSDGSDSSKF